MSFIMIEENFINLKHNPLIENCYDLLLFRAPHRVSSLAAWFTIAAGEVATHGTPMPLHEALGLPVIAGCLVGGAVRVSGRYMSRQLLRLLAPSGPI